MKLSIKRFICLACTLCMLFLLCTSGVSEAYSTYHNTSLISSTNNSSNGIIKVNVTVPAKTTVTIQTYPNKKVGNKQYGPQMEKNTVYLTNNSSKKKLMEKVIPVNFYGEYIVHASHGWKGSLWDQHICSSKLTKTIYTSKYKWTAKRVKQYKVGQVMTTAASLGIDATVTAIVPGGKLKTLVGVVLGGNSLFSAVNTPIASESTIDVTPIANYSWRYKLVGTNKNIKFYLECYNSKNVLTKTTYISTIPYTKEGRHVRVIR